MRVKIPCSQFNYKNDFREAKLARHEDARDDWSGYSYEDDAAASVRATRGGGVAQNMTKR